MDALLAQLWGTGEGRHTVHRRGNRGFTLRVKGERRTGYRQKFRMWAALVIIGSVVSLIGPQPVPVQAQEVDPLTVSVTVDRIRAIDDFGGVTGEAADFSAEVRIHGDTATSDIALDQDDVALDFTHTAEFASDTEAVRIVLIVTDDDGLAGVESADLAPGDPTFVLFELNPQTCVLGSPINNVCGAEIVSRGDGTRGFEIAEITFHVEVDGGEGIDELNVICTHDSIWPQAGEAVEITARSTNFQYLPRFADKVEIWFNNTTSPVVTETMSTGTTVTTPPLSGATTFSYGCRLTKDGVHLFSGWKTVQVGNPTAERPVAVGVTGAADDTIDILFVADSTSFSAGPTDPGFLDAVEKMVRKGIYGRPDMLAHQHEINIWIASDVGTVAPGSDICPVLTQPAGIDSVYRFAEAVAFVHTQDLRDCAPGRSFSVKASADDSDDIFMHELGHAAFGLADEYDGDGGYFMARNFPNLFFSAAQCARDAPTVRSRTSADCRPVRQDADRGGRIFFTHDPAVSDLMVDEGQIRALDRRAIDGTFALFPNGLPGPRGAGASPSAEPTPSVDLHRDQQSLTAVFALPTDGSVELVGVEQFAGVAPRYPNPPNDLVVRTSDESGLVDEQWMADPRRVNVYDSAETLHNTDRQDAQLLVPLDPALDKATLTIADGVSGDVLIEKSLVRSDLGLSIVDVDVPRYVPFGTTATATATVEVENLGPNGPSTSAVELTTGGGAGSATTSAVRVSLDVGETKQVDIKFPISCKSDAFSPSTSFVARLDLVDVIDPNLVNNLADYEGAFECVEKAPINIGLTWPDGEREVADDSVELAVLGTPEFDTAAIDSSTLRFGGWDTVSRGGGAEPSASPYIEDTWSDEGEEPDGIEDLVATFPLSGSGLIEGDDGACVVFRARSEDEWHNYFGCNEVELPSSISTK